MSDAQARAGTPDGATAEPAAATPSLGESLRIFRAAGREGLHASLHTGRALRRLVAADLALARVALVRALVWLIISVAFGASAWILLMSALIALLHRMGWSWLASITATAGISLFFTALGAWQALRYLEMSKLDATRRQLAKLGIGNSDEDHNDASAPTGKASE
ncbi:hypothetical protein [Xanthomonas albilineans]|uniref:hypothetical protein n=1 Tax=Xanthomonas albilineans TaxID=29447 RepID=UPI0005F30EB7|nr:hypothetical protein [Xanthomonas albilineans]PPU92049.1 hypothetical protein XalbCFBP2523_12435 [Xanthomonas albilineans]